MAGFLIWDSATTAIRTPALMGRCAPAALTAGTRKFLGFLDAALGGRGLRSVHSGR